MDLLQRQIKVGDVTVTVRELTLNEILGWLGEAATEQQESAFEVLILKDMSLRELARMTDLTREQMGDFAPSQLRQVVEVCKEVNADFFRVTGEVVARMKQVTT